MNRKLTATALLLLLSAQPVFAAECKQEKAIYADRDGAYELKFEAVDSEAASSSYRFTISIKNTDIMLNGFVMGSEPVNRPNGILFHNCPEGDTTGAEIAKCTVWQGVIYGTAGGKIELLPVTGSPAASEVLLPGLPLGLIESTAWGKGKATVVPWEAFSLKGCQS